MPKYDCMPEINKIEGLIIAIILMIIILISSYYVLELFEAHNPTNNPSSCELDK
jgi:hypothetical protein